MSEQAEPEVEVILDFNGFSLQAGPLADSWPVPLPGQEVFFDDKIWKVERVIRSLDISWLRKAAQFASLLESIYGRTSAKKLLAEMTDSSSTYAGKSSPILAPPKLSTSGGKICRFIYIKLSRPHD
ncbi:MAG: hypothetical protein U0103_16690 [Candidatus Obscuribacterales bacterium]